jgi:hypothetical protein
MQEEATSMLRNHDVIVQPLGTENEREAMMQVYRSEDGQEQLFRMLRDLNALDQINDNRRVEMYNYAIFTLEKLGFLDEKKVKMCIAYMLSLPAMILDSQESAERDSFLEQEKQAVALIDSKNWEHIPY